MSKIGKQSVTIPSGVTVIIDGQSVNVAGPKGSLAWKFPAAMTVEASSADVRVRVAHPTDKDERALWGLGRSLIANMVIGVSRGFERKLEIQGIGYKAAAAAHGLTLEIGYSHSVEFALPQGVECAVEKNIITVRGIDKQAVGEVAARLRALRPPEPYKGKGIRYVGEAVRKKAGKAAKAAGAKAAP